MKEEFLHYVWRYALFSSKELRTTNNEPIFITKPGVANTNAGPDFLNAHITINGQKWVGNVEIHLKSSDWYRHNHEHDVNYDAVILHVVYEDDVTVFMKNNKPLPTLILKDNIEGNLLHNYEKLLVHNKKWIPCEKDIASTTSFIFNNWLERLYIERLEQKAIFIKELLLTSGNNYEAVLFQLLAKNFGLKVNAMSFLSLAQSLDFSIIRKESFNENQLAALLFGQAGFLEETIEDPYHKGLKETYQYQQRKYKLAPLTKNQFQFFRMRPTNFPTIRIAQLVALYSKHQNLFSKLMASEKIATLYDILTIQIDAFWQTHYTFEKKTRKSRKKMTKSFMNLLLINTIIPLKYVYQKERKEIYIDDFLQLIKQLPPEKNSIIKQFTGCNVKVNNAFESQALLQLKNEYCAYQKCLKCHIGNSLVRQVN